MLVFVWRVDVSSLETQPMEMDVDQMALANCGAAMPAPAPVQPAVVGGVMPSVAVQHMQAAPVMAAPAQPVAFMPPLEPHRPGVPMQPVVPPVELAQPVVMQPSQPPVPPTCGAATACATQADSATCSGAATADLSTCGTQAANPACGFSCDAKAACSGTPSAVPGSTRRYGFWTYRRCFGAHAPPAEAEKPKSDLEIELAAMGWNAMKSCRPQASPQGTLPSNASGSDKPADALVRKKSQVFPGEDEPPVPAASVGAAALHEPVPAASVGAVQPVQPAPSVGAAAPEGKLQLAMAPAKVQQFPAPQAAGRVQTAQPDGEYTRRAAANLIQRLKKNPGRLTTMPSLHQMVFDEEKKNELITMICENGGKLEQVQCHLQQMEERGRVFSARKKALRWTKKQMQDAYGEDADKVMKHKESMGMVEEDENCPDGIVYLVAQREDEEDNFSRSGTAVTTSRVQVNASNAADVAEIMMGPPKSSGKRPSSSDAGSVQSSPTTPASAPGTPLPDQAPAKRAKVKKATEQTVLTPLQKAKDMCTKLLKKKSDASNLGLTLQSVAYADALSAEMTQFAKKFEELYLKIQAMINDQKNEEHYMHEDEYIPLVKEFIALQKQFEKPHAGYGFFLNVDDVDSALICRMAERVSEGKLSVRAAAECAQTFIHDGGSKAFCFWKGDMEAHAYAHLLTRTQRYYRCAQCCDFCLATSNKRSPELSWGNLSLKSLWRSTLTLTDPHDISPWTQVPRFEKKRRLLDLLHIVHLGTLRDLIPAAIISSLEDGSLPFFFGLTGKPWDEVLHAFSHLAAAWAKDQDMQLGIGTLSMARLGRPKYRHWPMPALDTRIKAAKTRTLFAFTTWMMVRLADSDALDTNAKKMHAKMRAVCCWSLDVPLSTWNVNGKVVMLRATVREVTWLCRLHSASYQWLSARCLAEQRLLYKCRPKTHYFVHMVDHFEETQICLMHASTFGDEDYMGKIRCICQGCHGATYMLTWARRYALKRALQWTEMKLSPFEKS
ncbi:unnamed protein product [Cladocopium goreaui]|uniref:Uncharacterized protein n=1 Tax=Cladocopium goreaui TaxID=2562237 RepID=A0A9P1GMK2_9DINO|nr:unnamed protein product [Cladocopium goreaui]